MLSEKAFKASSGGLERMVLLYIAVSVTGICQQGVLPAYSLHSSTFVSVSYDVKGLNLTQVCRTQPEASSIFVELEPHALH